jgi:ATP-dependent Clp protease ATP-binding subunit ClpA
MMFERFTDAGRQVVIQAPQEARQLGHRFVGCEHLLLAAAASSDPAGALLRAQGVTPERVRAEILRLGGPGPLAGLDAEALASIGIDLDLVQARIEAAFGAGALQRAVPVTRRRRRPSWGKGPVARLRRRRRGQWLGLHAPGSPNAGLMGRAPDDLIPFTPRAKKAMQLALREAHGMHDGMIRVQHLILALLRSGGPVPAILAGLGTSPASLRASILDHYRKAS